MIEDLARMRSGKTGRFSSWDESGRNADCWTIQPGETRVLADIKGPACITHIWMTQANPYRECLLKITYDNGRRPTVPARAGGRLILTTLATTFHI